MKCSKVLILPELYPQTRRESVHAGYYSLQVRVLYFYFAMHIELVFLLAVILQTYKTGA